MTPSSPYPVLPAALASAGQALAAQFPQWEVGVIAGTSGMWGAYWRSQDGRHRRYVVAPSAPELLAALRSAAAPGL